MKNKSIVIIAIGSIITLVVISIILSLNKPTPPSANNSNLDKQAIPTEFPQQEITATNSGFEPEILNIKVNSVVVWYNRSDNEISINSDPHPEHTSYPELNLGNVSATNGATQTYFSQPGTYTYHNHLKPEQKGTIIVEK